MRNTRTPPRPRVPVAKDCAQPAVETSTLMSTGPHPPCRLSKAEGLRRTKELIFYFDFNQLKGGKWKASHFKQPADSRYHAPRD